VTRLRERDRTQESHKGDRGQHESVERALLKLPGIDDAVVFGLPDPDLGEDVAAVVVTTASLETAGLRSQLRDDLASFAVPRHWLMRATPFPENHAGKVDRAAVIAEARAELNAVTVSAASPS
jgi:acyl-CoA synthetase (AMP-forming)/AMP-acid ligase II